MKTKTLKNQKGFTMVEIILTISLVAILFAVTGTIMMQVAENYGHIASRSPQLQSSRYAFMRMIEEMRTLSSSNGLTSISSTAIGFTDSGGASTDFTCSGSDITRGGNLLLSNVTSCTFTGYDGTSPTPNETNTAANVRMIKIDITVTPPNEVTPVRMMSQVFLRNYLYTNYQ